MVRGDRAGTSADGDSGEVTDRAGCDNRAMSVRDPRSGDVPVRAEPATTDRLGLAGLDEGQLAAWVAARGQPSYRVRQIMDAVWRDLVSDAEGMTTLPVALREELAAAFPVDTLESTDAIDADGGLTTKALHRLVDGARIESVLMRYPARAGRRARATVCISSQAGCAVGCPFCATGELGFGRDLAVSEILDQVRWAGRRLSAEGSRLTNVVFMGMGEPLLNLDAVLAAVEALADPRRLGLAARNVTVSTSGVVPGIRRLTGMQPRFTLAISLHAARDALRDVLVPLNRRWPVAEVVQAATDHAERTGRRVSYEVTMIAGINDTPADADALARLLQGRLAHVNLIPMNAVAHTPWRASDPDTVRRFADRLEAGGVPVSVRRNRGQEIGAACGQLAAERAAQPAPATVARRRERIELESLRALRGERSAGPAPVGVGD